jgi:HAD superfamily hydrolase (TIGR01509 family)
MKQNARLQAVTFDMDGLMFNSEDVYTLAGTELLSRRGPTFTPELKDAMMGLPPQKSFEAMIAHHALDEPWQALAAESNAIYLGLLEHHLATMPGLMELLSALERAGIPKAIATSSSRRLTTACLDPFQLAPRFRFILTCEDITHGKPNPEIYLLAAERFGIPPSEMLVLEDSQNGCRAAAAAGAYTVAVPGEHSRRQDFSAADLIIESLRDARLYEALGVQFSSEESSPLPDICGDA